MSSVSGRLDDMANRIGSGNSGQQASKGSTVMGAMADRIAEKRPVRVPDECKRSGLRTDLANRIVAGPEQQGKSAASGTIDDMANRLMNQ